mgnify:CR=1 FL=1
METDAIKKFIQKIPFFSVFNDHELNKLVGREKIFKDCKKGETIFKEGDSGASLFVLLFGEIELVKSSERGPEAIIMELQAGTVFGEIAMLTKRRRNLAARASSTKVVVMEFSNTFIDRLIPSVQTKFHKQLLSVLAKNLDNMNMRYAKLASSIEVRKQLADRGDIK